MIKTDNSKKMYKNNNIRVDNEQDLHKNIDHDDNDDDGRNDFSQVVADSIIIFPHDSNHKAVLFDKKFSMHMQNIAPYRIIQKTNTINPACLSM